MSKDSTVYQMNKQGAEAGKAVYEHLAQACENSRKSMEDVLLKILRENSATDYGQKYDFASINSIEDYKKKVPVITYEAISEDIERMKMGEQNVLTVYPFQHMNETSGTVGSRKYVPLTQPQMQIFMQYSNQLLQGILANDLEGDEWMEGRCFCTSEGTHTTLPSGITVGCASSMMADVCKGGVEPYSSMLKAMYTSPPEAMGPGPGTNTKYMHTRFAMMDRDVTGITSGFISTVMSLMHYIRENYQVLIDDIEKGTISPDIEMSDADRASLLKRIEPMPERAAELREIFKNGADFQFVPQIWPKMQYINAVGGDGFTVYDENMVREYTGDKIHRLYCGITASEGIWSVPVGLDTLGSVIVPDGAFIEFQPVEAEDDFSQIKTVDELEEGKIYELVVTTYCGYYRYRMSDAVKVVGFWHNAPLVQFMFRVNKTINLACEKTTEQALRVTAENVAKRLNFNLIDYEVYPDTSSMPPTYDFLIEAEDDLPSRVSKEELNKVVCEELCKANPEYYDCLHDNQILPPRAWFEQAETQLLYVDKMVYKGASASQIKPVHVISNEEQKKFFMIMRNLWD